MNRLQRATAQELLAERRQNVLEAMGETDEMARLMLNAHVADIDAELQRRRGFALAEFITAVAREVEGNP